MYNVTVDEIKQANNLTSNTLSIGQNLVIPVTNNTSSTYIQYTVKSGDSLYNIAKMFNTTVDEIKTLNGLTSNLLSIGQILTVPSASSPSIPQLPQETYQAYIVKKGDSLYSIAKMFNMTVEELKTANNLTSNNLSIGQVLRVKKGDGVMDTENGQLMECYGSGFVESTYETYTVKKGDSLYSIARKFSTTVDNLIYLNNLKTNNLSIGQVLKIREK